MKTLAKANPNHHGWVKLLEYSTTEYYVTTPDDVDGMPYYNERSARIAYNREVEYYTKLPQTFGNLQRSCGLNHRRENMHNTIDYSKSPCPKTDAINDVKNWFGERWDLISPEMAKITNCNQFALAASFGGVQGFPVKAWYELYHGEGSWKLED